MGEGSVIKLPSFAARISIQQNLINVKLMSRSLSVGTAKLHNLDESRVNRIWESYHSTHVVGVKYGDQKKVVM